MVEAKNIIKRQEGEALVIREVGKVANYLGKGNIISCDVFSTYRDGKSIGTEEFLLLDTITWEYQGIKV